MKNIYKCSIVLAPATDEDIRMFENSFYSLYGLYKNENSNEIKIAIPGMVNHVSVDNMDEFNNSQEKAYFINLGNSGIELADIINERPIYMIEPTDKRTVGEYTIVNGIDIPLENILNDNCKKLKKC